MGMPVQSLHRESTDSLIYIYIYLHRGREPGGAYIRESTNTLIDLKIQR